MKQESAPPEAPAKTAAAAASQPRAMTPPPAVKGEGRDEAVRRMAYLLYVERGCIDGHEVEDWLRAEVLVDQELAVTVPGIEPPPVAAKRAPAKRGAAKPVPAGAVAPKAAAKRAPAKSRSQ